MKLFFFCFFIRYSKCDGKEQRFLACTGGACLFKECKNIQCTGGACVFDRCSNAMCHGGGCNFINYEETLGETSCMGENCRLDGTSLPVLHKGEFLTV
jgi:hypothetical protein